tara:strand:- start:47 stop:832 length:786 start_codon:yes stop_codon:yes gene_type:complete
MVIVGITSIVVVNAQETAKEKAQKLDTAMNGGFFGWGTDEDVIFNVLESAETQDEKNLILKEYKTISGRRLADDLKSELNDSDYTRALGGLLEGSLYDYSSEVDSAEMTESAKKRAEEVIKKSEQGESIEETEAERTIRESRERDTQKQIIKLQKKATEQDKEFVPLETIPGVIEGGNTDLNQFFNGLFKFGIIIAGFLAVVMIAVGGIQYMSTDAIHGKSEGRERITYALMGLLLILFSWILLNTVNPDILDFSNDALFK